MGITESVKDVYNKVGGCDPKRLYGGLLVGSLIGALVASKYDLSMGYAFDQVLEDIKRAPAKIFSNGTKIPVF